MNFTILILRHIYRTEVNFLVFGVCCISLIASLANFLLTRQGDLKFQHIVEIVLLGYLSWIRKKQVFCLYFDIMFFLLTCNDTDNAKHNMQEDEQCIITATN